MEKYKVILYPRAFRDVEDIYAYIANSKLEPAIAKNQTDRIWDALKALEIMPDSHQDRLVGRFANKGYKQLIIDNFIAIYKIDDINRKVYILTIQYGGRDI